MGDEKQFFNFSDALELLKTGNIVSREAWNNPTIKVLLQKPDEHSKMTKPYLYMEKSSKNPANTGGENDNEHAPIIDRFPLDLSCESVLADDWFVVETGM